MSTVFLVVRAADVDAQVVALGERAECDDSKCPCRRKEDDMASMKEGRGASGRPARLRGPTSYLGLGLFSRSSMCVLAPVAPV